MKHQKVKDERVMAQRQKINSEAYGILMAILLVSILAQQFIFKAPLKQYAAEAIGFFAMSIYMIVRYLNLGVNLESDERKTKSLTLVNSLVTGIAVTAINGFLNYHQYADKYKADGIGYFLLMLLVTFISSSLLVFMTLFVIHDLNKKKQRKIQKKLDEKEQED